MQNHLLDVDTPYIPASSTDVLRTLKRSGWVPPSETEESQEKWAYIRTAFIRNKEKLK